MLGEEKSVRWGGAWNKGKGRECKTNKKYVLAQFSVEVVSEVKTQHH